MPRLSDLLPDNLKKQLIAESKKSEQRGGNRPGQSELPGKRKPDPAPAMVIPDFVAIDVETTGLDFSTDRVIEIGAVKFVGGKPGDEFSSFINPGRQVPQVITDLTGITNDDARTAPSFGAMAGQLLDFIGNLPLCGHQITFDITFLNKELDRAGAKTLTGNSLDTALLSRILSQSGIRFSLKSVSAALDITLDHAHRALHDAKASGEVAVQLIPRLADLPAGVRQTMGAAAPASFLKTLIFQSLGAARPRVNLRMRQALAPMEALAAPEEFSDIDEAAVKKIFSPGGGLEKAMTAFTLRTSQLAMATEVASAFNTKSILIAEAGTGTGKSLAYLVPASLWALENNCRVAVTTHTRNLQDQLLLNDLPLVGKAVGRKLRYCVLKGRANYICLSRFERLLRGEAGNLSVRDRFAILPLIPWVESDRDRRHRGAEPLQP